MNRKTIISGIVIIALAAGAFFLWRSMRGSGKAESAGGGDDENVPTVVTVQTGKLQRETLHGYVEGFGQVAAAPAASANVASPVAGVVTEAKAVEGQTVQKGDLLFQLDSRVADVAVEYAEKTAARQRDLLRLKNTSQKAVQDAEEQLAAAKTQQELLRIRAPIAGTVTHVQVHAGEAVDLATVLAAITDLHRLVVNADIPAAEAGAVQAGQAVELETDPPVASSVSFIGAGVQASNGAVLVRAPLPEGSRMRLDQFVPLRIVTITHSNCLAAPAESVVKNADGSNVVAIVANDAAAQAPVEVGLRENGLVEVEGPGLKEGDTVVTVGAYGLPAKTKIKVQAP
ncbi:MAG TPA: efflux RND transporter periplasmic adaptor subunit [Verrucomicrobiae bacterium]|jgi:RND family efflux transporter MFP subunit